MVWYQTECIDIQSILYLFVHITINHETHSLYMKHLFCYRVCMELVYLTYSYYSYDAINQHQSTFVKFYIKHSTFSSTVPGLTQDVYFIFLTLS